ncbi:hypothetical protein RchiOBHm_Chr5g0026451 [Rosa chinensis]|uniref:Uncharacterized protein n=1 Tax=Rosa chinensis TaxID=74649 RepID=A0A2P6Q8U0_ROSCH|nr:hypothetical protein RchiOBHm_Chr5g0026451 [Rosa chinensis]
MFCTVDIGYVLFIFGSFSKDETKSLLLKQSPGKPSPMKGEMPVESNVLQFGSIDFVTDKSLVELNGESKFFERAEQIAVSNNKHNEDCKSRR